MVLHVLEVSDSVHATRLASYICMYVSVWIAYGMHSIQIVYCDKALKHNTKITPKGLISRQQFPSIFLTQNFAAWTTDLRIVWTFIVIDSNVYISHTSLDAMREADSLTPVSKNFSWQ